MTDKPHGNPVQLHEHRLTEQAFPIFRELNKYRDIMDHHDRDYLEQLASEVVKHGRFGNVGNAQSWAQNRIEFYSARREKLDKINSTPRLTHES